MTEKIVADIESTDANIKVVATENTMEKTTYFAAIALEKHLNSVSNEEITQYLKENNVIDTEIDTIINGLSKPIPKENLYRPEPEFRIYNEKGKVVGLDYISVANYLIKNHNFITFGDQIYYYKEGVYIIDWANTIVEKEIAEILINCGIVKLIDPIKQTVKAIKEIKLQNGSPFEKNPFELHENNLMCVKNGVLQFDFDKNNVTLLLHDPKFMFNEKLVVEYEEKEDTTEARKFIERLATKDGEKTFDKDKYEMLLQIPAHALLQRLLGITHKKSYLLFGETDSGKTSYLEHFLIDCIFGKDAVSNIDFADVVSDRKFDKHDLEGKYLNIFDDLANVSVKAASRFKAITGGGTIEIERKYSNSYKISKIPVFAFSANSFPKVTDVYGKDKAFWERWLLLKFENKFGKNPNFKREIKQYAKGFFKLVIEKMFEIYHNNGVLSGVDVSSVLIEEWKRENDAFEEFCYQNICDGEYASVSKTYNEFIEFYNQNGYEKNNKPRKESFSQLIHKKYNISPMKDNRKYVTIDGRTEQIRVYWGIALKSDIDKLPKTEIQQAIA